jgi:uncharacterized protein YeaO (DUF488 family)
MMMVIRTKRWNDPRSPDDGFRLLICRYRPRGVPANDEPWDGWCSALAPSKALHAAAYGKSGEPLDFAEYERRFREEMKGSASWIADFARVVRDGTTLTLLCSSACTDEARCHRTIVKALLESALSAEVPHRGVVRRV